MSTIKVAVTQAEPEWLDLAGSVKKAVKLIAEAAAEDAKIIAFPELWLPGYPLWIWYICFRIPTRKHYSICDEFTD